MRAKRPNGRHQAVGFQRFVEVLESRLLLSGDIDLTGYTQTFADEFNNTSVNVTANSPKGGSTWYYWPPYGAAGAYSASTWDTAAFSASGGIMQDKAFKDANGQWHSGNLSSMDNTGAGFAQQYGYFEINAKMPNSGSGAWPAFWIMSQNSILNNLNGTSLPNEEIDVFEWYGVAKDNNQAFMQQASHNWTPSGGPDGLYSPQTPMPGGALPWQDFHTYGVQVDPSNITWYIDGVQTNQIATPAGYVTSPNYMMIDYALGGGWPLDGMVENSHLDVDWVRVYALPSNPTAPAAPNGLSATAASASQINLSWTDNSNNETGFKVERATDSAFTQNLSQVATTAAGASSYSDTGLSSSSTYYYRVRATNSAGDSANSNTASATTQSQQGTGGQLTGTVIGTTGTYQNSPSWDRTKVFDGNLSTYFDSDLASTGWAGLDLGSAQSVSQIKYAPRSGWASRMIGGKFQASNTADFSSGVVDLYTVPSAPAEGSLTSVSITPVSYRYYRYLSPTNGFANVAEVEFWSGSGGTSSAPAAPTALSATATSASQINLSWTDNSSDETGFKIERATDSAFTQNLTLVTTTAAGATGYSNTGLASNTSYYYRVRATNSAGDSANSNTASATTQSQQGTGGQLTGTIIGTTGSYGNSGSDRTKVFDGDLNTYMDSDLASTGWAGLDLGSAQILSQIKYAPRSGWASRMVGGKFQASNTADFSSGVVDLYTVPSAPPEGSLTAVSINPVTYRYYRYLSPTNGYANVAEVEFWGGNSSASPAAPTSLAASAVSANQINLSWTDNSTNETGFKIERATDSAFTQNLSQVATTAAGATSYSDTGLSSNSTYYYRIRATNSAGDSANSNTASATTQSQQGTGGPLTGTVIGTTGSYGNSGSDRTKVFDGDLNTYMDSDLPSTGWAGLDLGSAQSVSQIKYAPRSGWASRMVGGKFQASNTADFSSGVVDLYTVPNAPTEGVLTSVSITPVSYRYYRYLSPTNGYANVAEVEFWGGSGGTSSAPAAPTALAASAVSASQINLNWTDNSSDETGFKIERATDSAFSQNLTLVTTTAAGATSYSDTGLSSSSTYYYRVRATNSAGDSANSNTASATTQTGSTSNAIVNPSFETPALNAGSFTYTPAGSSWTFTGMAGIQSNGSAYSGSTNVAPDGTQTALLQGNGTTLGSMSQVVNLAAGSHTLSFYASQRWGQTQPIKVTIDGAQIGSTISPSSNSFSPYSISFSVAASGNHTIQFEATDNTADKTSFIDQVSLDNTSTGLPAQVTGLSATAAGATQINLAWSAVSGATSYNIYRGTSSGGESATPIATGVAGTTFSNTGLNASTTYYYKVAAVNTSGTGSQSAEASATTQAAGSAPAQVTGLSATAASASQINLSWSAVGGATSYNIYRGTTSGGESATPIATGITATNYSDAGLAASTTYYYKVAALNAAGIGAQSSEAGATTQAGGGGSVPRIIFDSDMSSDWDDVGDIAVLHGLSTLGEVDIIGMMVSSQNGGTPLAMDAINTYYGEPDIPIGVRPDIGGVGGYPGQIASQFPHDLASAADCPLAVNLYRQLLAASPDKSVIIATTGYLNNLQALLQSGPDQYSSLSGMDLVRQKVKLWACAGGAFPEGDEFNFRVEPAAASYVINNWPTAVTYTPFNVGQDIYTAGRADELPTDSPIRRVYVDIENQYPYPSWGQIAIYQSVRGSNGLWGEVNVGRNNADSDGHNYWTTTPDPTGADDQKYLTELARTPVRESLDALFMLPPNNGTPSIPGAPSDLRSTAFGNTRIDLSWTDNAYNENGFIIERRDASGAYTQIATVGANVHQYSDTSLTSVADTAYRVEAYNATGQSIAAYNYYYTGWTENSAIAPPAGTTLYTYYQHSDLRWDRGGDFRPDHVVLNNDSQHGQNLTISVDVSALGAQGNFYIYFFYQDEDNWYRLNVGEQDALFEKSINGTISQVGSSAPISNLGNGSDLRNWRIQVNASGQMTFTQDGVVILNVSSPLSFSSGKIGLGGNARTPVWENFWFLT